MLPTFRMRFRAKALLCAVTCLAGLLTAATFAAAVDQSPKDGCTSPETYAGSITSQSFVPASGATPAQVRFQGWFEVESVAPGGHDTTYVEYSLASTPDQWVELGTLIEQAEVANTGGRADQPYSNKGTDVPPDYQAFAFDLPDDVGTIRVRIRFDTVDTIFQGFRGVAVDGIQLDTGQGVLRETFEDPQTVTWTFDQASGPGAPFWQIVTDSQNVTVKNPEVNPDLVTLPDAGELPDRASSERFAWFGNVASGTFCGPDFANRAPAEDTSPPDTSITAAPPGSTASSDASFEFTSSEPGSSFECQLDGGGFIPCASPQTYSALADTGHSFEVRSTDPFGNVDPTPAVHAWTVRPATLADLPAPELGVDVNAQTASGTVLVGIPGTAARSAGSGSRASQKGVNFVPLSEARQVPVGSFFDTRRGTVRLQSARDRAGTRQTGSFFKSLFQVRQSRKRSARGLTDLVLKGSSFRRCRTTGRGKGASAAVSRRTIRRLRSNASGRFRTRGRTSSATVRGTIWDTIDRCDGTLTKVRRGRVVVRDFRRKRNVLLRAGKSYLARAPR
jgi:hypothetical protein